MLSQVPDNAEIYLRVGDNAWPATLRAFSGDRKNEVTVYFEQAGLRGYHRNHPCLFGDKIAYTGVEEIPLTTTE